MLLTGACQGAQPSMAPVYLPSVLSEGSADGSLVDTPLCFPGTLTLPSPPAPAPAPAESRAVGMPSVV